MIVWIFQTGEPTHFDSMAYRPMRAMNLMKALANEGHHVVLWTSKFFHQERAHRLCDNHYSVSETCEIRFIDSPGYVSSVSLSRFKDHKILGQNLKIALNKSKEKPDVAFVGFPPIEFAVEASEWLTRAGVPFLLDVKDQWPDTFLDLAPSVFRRVIRLAMSKTFANTYKLFNCAHGITSMSSAYLNWVREFSERQFSKWDMVVPLTPPNELIDDEKIAEAELWCKENGLAENDYIKIIFVGTLSRSFDFAPVARAIKYDLENDKRFEWIFCGDGDFKNKLSASLDFDNVHFTGWVDRVKIVALAKISHFGLAPYITSKNFTMNFPNKIVDYIQLGLGIITTLPGDVRSTLIDNNIGFTYNSEKNLDLIFKLNEFFKVNEKKDVSLRCRGLFQNTFSFELVYPKLVRNLEDLSESRERIN